MNIDRNSGIIIILNGAPCLSSYFCSKVFFVSSFADNRHLKLLPSWIKTVHDISIQNMEPDKHKIIAGGPYLCEVQDQQTCWDEKNSVLEEVVRNFLKVHGLYTLGTDWCISTKISGTIQSLHLKVW